MLLGLICYQIVKFAISLAIAGFLASFIIGITLHV